MMYVKTKLGKSKIHGIGLFADQFIPKGTVVWKFTPGFDRSFTKKQLAKLPHRAREYLEDGNTYTSRKSGLRIFPTDNAKFFNHSKNPNAISAYEKGEKDVVTHAIRNIKRGEEITEDYGAFETGWDDPF